MSRPAGIYTVGWVDRHNPHRRGLLKGNYTEEQAKELVRVRTEAFPHEIHFTVLLPHEVTRLKPHVYSGASDVRPMAVGLRGFR